MESTINTLKYRSFLKSERVFALLAGLNLQLDCVKGQGLTREPLPLWEVHTCEKGEESTRIMMLLDASIENHTITTPANSTFKTRRKKAA